MAINYHDGGGNPYAPYFTDINVDPADLAEFADLLDSDIDAINDAWERMKRDVDVQPYPNFPGGPSLEISYANGYPQPLNVGTGGIHEASEFLDAYSRTMGAEWFLMEEMIRGLEILRDAARKIHDGYLRTDAASGDNLEDAFEAYQRSSVIEAIEESRVTRHDEEEAG